MKNKAKLFGAIVLGGSIGLLANPAWLQAGDNYMNDHYMSNQSSSMNYSDQNQQFSASDLSNQHLSNQQMRRVERKLKAEGYDPGKIDGVFDSQTRQALSEFQRENNIPATGRINEQTLDELGLNNFWNQNRYSSNYNNYYNNNYNNEFSSSDIRDVQRALDREGYNPGQIDGQMDWQTRQALRQFQRDEGLAVTGQINQRTADRLGVDLQNNYNNAFSRDYNNDFSSSDIRHVQRALDREGYDPGQIDGRMDQQTRQALRQFQRDEGLAVTGQINQRTANRLGVNLQNNNRESSWYNWQSSSNNSNSR